MKRTKFVNKTKIINFIGENFYNIFLIQEFKIVLFEKNILNNFYLSKII